jgi:hypothetical protein
MATVLTQRFSKHNEMRQVFTQEAERRKLAVRSVSECFILLGLVKAFVNNAKKRGEGRKLHTCECDRRTPGAHADDWAFILNGYEIRKIRKTGKIYSGPFPMTATAKPRLNGAEHVLGGVREVQTDEAERIKSAPEL